MDMELEKELLSDYGSVPQEVGLSLLRKNSATFQNIKLRVSLSEAALRDGLSILIQRRFVKFFTFEKTIKYHFDRRMLYRRLYFPIYAKIISEKYSPEHLEFFLKVLTRGTVKILEEHNVITELINAGVFHTEIVGTSCTTDISHILEEDMPHKIRRINAKYLVVNYNTLDNIVFGYEMAKMVRRRYNEAACDVFKAVLKCDTISRDNIINNLESTKILLFDQGAIVNDKDNIDEYLRYLCGCGILCKGGSTAREYFVQPNYRFLRLHLINLLITNQGCKRIFNMAVSLGSVEDKTLTVGSLLSINKIKNTLLAMQRCGLLVQNCLTEYRGSTRIDHSWTVDLNYTCNLIRKEIEGLMTERLKLFNECWDHNYFMDNADGNEQVWISDLIGMSTDHLIFGID